MGYLSYVQIIETTLPVADVDVPEWSGKVQVRAITTAEVAKARRTATNPRTKDLDELRFNAYIVVVGCVDPEFPPEGADQLIRKAAAGAVARIAAVIVELSGLGEDDEDDDQGEA